jgi:hypothetical protein
MKNVAEDNERRHTKFVMKNALSHVSTTTRVAVLSAFCWPIPYFGRTRRTIPPSPHNCLVERSQVFQADAVLKPFAVLGEVDSRPILQPGRQVEGFESRVLRVHAGHESDPARFVLCCLQRPHPPLGDQLDRAAYPDSDLHPISEFEAVATIPRSREYGDSPRKGLHQLLHQFGSNLANV